MEDIWRWNAWYRERAFANCFGCVDQSSIRESPLNMVWKVLVVGLKPLLFIYAVKRQPILHDCTERTHVDEELVSQLISFYFQTLPYQSIPHLRILSVERGIFQHKYRIVNFSFVARPF